MDLFSNTPDVVLDLIFAQLSEYDLHETHRVSRCWFWASIRRIEEVRITREYNPLKVWADFYNNHHRSPNEDVLDWRHLFQHLVLKKLVIKNDDKETINYLMDNGCNTIELIIFSLSNGTTPLSLASLRNFTRMQFFEYHLASGTFTPKRSMEPFAVECLKDFDFGDFGDYDDKKYDEDFTYKYKFRCEIHRIKLTSDGWHNSEDSVLKSITSLSVSYVRIEFLRKLIDLCSNLQEIYCSNVEITQDWHQVFPANIKRIGLHSSSIEWNVDEIFDSYMAMGRQLLPFLCQTWESVEIFELEGKINSYYQIDYVAYPSKREESLECAESDGLEGVDLASPIFQCRNIKLTGDCWLRRTEPYIPKVNIVKFEIEEYNSIENGVSLHHLFFEPGQVEHLSIDYQIMNDLGHEHFEDNDFAAFTGLTSLSLSLVTAVTIKTFLDQCLWIKKLKLDSLAPMTLDKLPEEAIYENVSELRLKYCCSEQIDKVFTVFPCLSIFIQQQHVTHQDNESSVEWLCQKLSTSEKMYSFVYRDSNEVCYMHNDNLEPVLSLIQVLLEENSECTCYMKGFKASPRVPAQKVIYMS